MRCPPDRRQWSGLASEPATVPQPCPQHSHHLFWLTQLYGFYLTDEPLDSTCAAAVTAYTKFIHDNAPGKISFILLTDWPGTYAAYRPAITGVDLVGIDPYPVKDGTYDSTLIQHEVSDAMAAGIPLANIVPVFQTFGGAGWDAPSATQLTTILGQWATLVPNPPLDYAYSWGTQSNYLSEALGNRADWRDIMTAHNNSQNPNIFALFLPLIQRRHPSNKHARQFKIAWHVCYTKCHITQHNYVERSWSRGEFDGFALIDS
jgi:hypothetical protein